MEYGVVVLCFSNRQGSKCARKPSNCESSHPSILLTNNNVPLGACTTCTLYTPIAHVQMKAQSNSTYSFPTLCTHIVFNLTGTLVETPCQPTRPSLWPQRTHAIHPRPLRLRSRRVGLVLALRLIHNAVSAVLEALAQDRLLGRYPPPRGTTSLSGNNTRAKGGLGLRMRMLLLNP